MVEYSLVSCDRCFANHRKCDKLLSGCSVCLKAGIQCMYTIKRRGKTKLKYNSAKNGTSQHIFKLNSSLEENNKAFIQAPVKDKTFNPILKCFFLMKSPVGIASNFLNLSKLKVHQLFTLNSFVVSVNKVKPKIESNGTNWPMTTSNIDITALLLYSEEIYFMFINPIIPLFLKSSFNKYKRDPILRTLIWAIGLQLLKVTDHTTCLLDNLTAIIWKNVRFDKIEPSLSTIQKLIILYLSCRWSRRDSSNVTNFLEIAMHMSYQIGLHKSLPKRYQNANYDILIERQLAFNTLLKLMSFLYMSLNHHIYNPTPPLNRFKNKNFTNYLSHYDQVVVAISVFYNLTNKIMKEITLARAMDNIEDDRKREIDKVKMRKLADKMDQKYRSVFNRIYYIRNQFYINNKTINLESFHFESLFFGQFVYLTSYLNTFHQTIKLQCYKANFKTFKNDSSLAKEVETTAVNILNSGLQLGPYNILSLMLYSLTCSLAALKSLHNDDLTMNCKESLYYWESFLLNTLETKKRLIQHPVLFLYFSLAFGEIKVPKWIWPTCD